jgi:2-succinyl-6-hydroxy-2,4-cyclohexadiene-1-carboxylate synthase
MESAVAQVAQAIGEFTVPNLHILGYSMGGRVALNLALSEPSLVATVSLIGASPGIADPAARQRRREADNKLAESLETRGLADFVRDWMAQPLFESQSELGDEYIEEARRQRMRNDPHALALSLKGMGTGAVEPVMGKLGSIGASTLVITGENDKKFTELAARMADEMPQARSLVIPGSGHAVHIEAPAPLATGLEAFLRKAEGTTPRRSSGLPGSSEGC